MREGEWVSFLIVYSFSRRLPRKRLPKIAKLIKIIPPFRKEKKPLPFPLKNEIIYYTGPTPAKPSRPIGSCGPTTSFRMDSFTPLLLSKGLRGMIGKGSRSPEIRKSIKKYKAIYFLALGGGGAYLSQRVKRAEIIAFADLGPEAVYKLWVEDFPAIIGIDSRGEDLYNV